MGSTPKVFSNRENNMVESASPCPRTDISLAISPSNKSSKNDFDFLHGSWTVHNRKLRSRLTNSNDWAEFESRCECGPILNGFANQDFFHASVDGENFEATTVRLFDPKTRLWSIYWADSKNLVMDVPMVGSFEDDVGIFLARDNWEGKPVTVKFRWDKSDPDLPTWSQAFSEDDGATWESNWYMTFTPTNTATDEQKILEIIDRWALMTRTGRQDEVLANHSPDLIIFDVLPPLKYASAEEYRSSWDEWQPKTTGDGIFEIRDLSIATGSDVAFASALIRCGGTRPDGLTFEDWVRATFCLRKNESRWLITHQHVSMPIGKGKK